jgi:hypothetical protein
MRSPIKGIRERRMNCSKDFFEARRRPERDAKEQRNPVSTLTLGTSLSLGTVSSGRSFGDTLLAPVVPPNKSGHPCQRGSASIPTTINGPSQPRLTTRSIYSLSCSWYTCSGSSSMRNLLRNHTRRLLWGGYNISLGCACTSR